MKRFEARVYEIARETEVGEVFELLLPGSLHAQGFSEFAKVAGTAAYLLHVKLAKHLPSSAHLLDIE